MQSAMKWLRIIDTCRRVVLALSVPVFLVWALHQQDGMPVVWAGAILLSAHLTESLR